jgi:ribonuclease HIII
MLTIKVDKDNLEKIEADYKDKIIQRNIGYILFVIKTQKNIITAFTNKKGVNFKVTIQGDDAQKIGEKYVVEPIIIPKKDKYKKESPFYIDVDHQIGSDEVGTGDFLGPIVVCAAYCDQETLKLINEYNIKDSKKFTDLKILEVIPLLLKKVFFEYKVLSNERYNAAVKSGFNMVKIKCILHNHVLTRLHARFPYVKNLYIDQFVPKENYFNYLKGIKHIEEGLVFKEKGETYFPSVALASCIARYYFLEEMRFKSKKIGMKIPFGAGEQVNEFSKKFIEKYGFEEFSKLCKQNFKNYEEIKNIDLFDSR